MMTVDARVELALSYRQAGRELMRQALILMDQGDMAAGRILRDLSRAEYEAAITLLEHTAEAVERVPASLGG